MMDNPFPVNLISLKNVENVMEQDKTMCIIYKNQLMADFQLAFPN